MALTTMPEVRPLQQPPPGVIFWFRQDLRLHDQWALEHAIERARSLGGWLLPVYVHDERRHAMTAWGFQRSGPHREAWVRMALHDLSTQLTAIGSSLLQTDGDPVLCLQQLSGLLGHVVVVCEEIAAPEEAAQVEALRRHGIPVQTFWQSTLVAPQHLPFLPQQVPDRFTTFRQILEGKGVRATPPLEAIESLPPLPPDEVMQLCRQALPACPVVADADPPKVDARAGFPWDQPRLHGGERDAGAPGPILPPGLAPFLQIHPQRSFRGG